MNKNHHVNAISNRLSLRKPQRGSSTLDDGHIREGVVVRVEGPGVDFHLKYKSFWFCELEGIAKNKDDYVDPEDIS